MAMPLFEGRMLKESDRAGAEAVAVINRTMARKFWPSENALNHRLRICSDCPWLRVVGEVSDIHQTAIDTEPRPEYYVPFDQLSQALGFAAPQDLAIRVSGDAAALAPAVRKAIWEVDPQQPVAQVRVLADYVDEDLAPRRFQTQLTGAFAAVALLLAALGIYGVLSYSVSQRRREIGVRMALGADQKDILALIARQGMRPAVTGLVIGFVAAYGLAHLISSLLYNVHPRDPITFGAAAVTLLGTALLACWLPARRAASVETGSVLHYE
jgi:predicted permease